MKLTREEFIEKAKLVHGDKYDYSLVEYIDKKTPIIIVCLKHGEFTQLSPLHIKGKICPHCGKEQGIRKNKERQKPFLFIENGKKVHGDKYDYSLVEYNGVNQKVKIICPVHGIFEQYPLNHSRWGCKKCVDDSKVKSIDKFIEDSKSIHGDKYDYTLVEYKNNNTKVKIICKFHGIFEQIPRSHSKGRGCSLCNSPGNVSEPKLFLKVKRSFKNEDIITQGKPLWLTRNQRFDIYFPKYNIAIEYQGGQHFHSVKWFGGEDTFKYTQELDERKRLLCLENKCELFYFTYNPKDIPIEYEHKIYSCEEELINEIKNNIL